jgi:annexin A7/11
MSSDILDPTVRPFPGFIPLNDAKTLRAAMKGFGTDEAAIIGILTKRSNPQRQEIIAAFKHEFGRDLIADLKSELGGKFEKLVLALMETPYNYLAQELYNATLGKVGTDEDVLTEILCTYSNADLSAIKSAFEARFGKSLEKTLGSELAGDYKRLLILLLNGVRDENAIPNLNKAREQAQDLYKAGEAVLGTDEEKFVVLLAHQSFAQLRQIFEEYKKISGKTLEEGVKSEFSGDLGRAILTIIKCAQGRPRYFADKLEEAMKGFGTDDSSLIRIIVSRCEVDLGAIKREYQNKFNRTLYHAVESETSGDYKAAMLALVGEP